jgi:hypothetical protein
MARVSLSDTHLRVDLEGLHRLWAMTRRITVPLAHVRGATVDPGVVAEPKGIRAPGLYIPGLATVGTFRRDGERYFWDVTNGARAVVIQLRDERYAALVVEVGDPRAVVDAVNGALAGTATQAPAQPGVFRPVDGGSVRSARLRG